MLTFRLPCSVRLGKTQKGCIETTAIVEIELIGLIDDGLRIGRRTEIEPSRRYASNHARFSRERHQIGDLLLIGDVRNAFRHADAEIDDAVGVELKRRAPRNDFPLVQLHRRN